MELFQTSDKYILVNGDACLMCSRLDGSLWPAKSTDIDPTWNAQCLGLIYGLVGKIHTHPESHPRLILIQERSLAGTLMGKHEVYRIKKILMLSLSPSGKSQLDIQECPKHTPSPETSADQQKALAKTWSSLKSAAENVKPKKKDVKVKEKFKKRILEELQKLLNEPNWFFYSETYDLTSRIQRQHLPNYDSSLPCWKRADDRFFWNRFLLKELVNHENDTLASPWIIPIMHGYIQMERCLMDFSENHRQVSPMREMAYLQTVMAGQPCLQYDIALISRRSSYRAGTRSKKRGLDENGHCANYVETEQIIEFLPHIVSFTQVRGSAPMFWSQTGFKYRPPPRVDKSR